jgi:hypothetical protein
VTRWVHALVYHASRAVTSHFLLIWLLALVFIVLCGALLSGSRYLIPASLSQHHTSDRKKGLAWELGAADTISAILFALFVALYVAVILYKEDFSYYDNDQFTDFSVQGRNFPPPIWPAIGRFFPLGFQEFNLLKFVTRSPAGYHLFAIAQLIILIVALFLTLKEFEVRYRVAILAVAMLVPSFVIAFTGLIYPERNVLFWLAIMLMCLYGHSRTKSRMYFVGCLAATHFALYYKETVVVLVVAFAASRLLLDYYRGRQASHRSWQEIAGDNALSLGMLAVSGIYLALFLATMLHGTSSYVVQHRQALGPVLLAYLQIDWLPLILIAVFTVRFWHCALSSGELDPLWHSLAIGAVGYFLCVMALQLNSGYYMAPVDLISVLYLARVPLVWLSRPTKALVFVIAIVIACVLLQAAAYSSFRIVERKSLIATKSQLADFLNGYLPTTGSRTVELFFPYASPYHLMGLSSYLKYKGFNLDGTISAGGPAGPRLVIEAREEFTNGKCVDYRDYACTHAESAGPGALIVIMPDDNVSMDDVAESAQGSVSLLAVNTSVPAWFRLLHAVSSEFSTTSLPGHWLQLNVFQRP